VLILNLGECMFDSKQVRRPAISSPWSAPGRGVQAARVSEAEVAGPHRDSGTGLADPVVGA